jgi:hypothetical protein
MIKKYLRKQAQFLEAITIILHYYYCACMYVCVNIHIYARKNLIILCPVKSIFKSVLK